MKPAAVLIPLRAHFPAFCKCVPILLKIPPVALLPPLGSALIPLLMPKIASPMAVAPRIVFKIFPAVPFFS